MRVDPASGFRGIEMSGTDAEIHYAARVEEVKDGFPALANVYYSSPKQQAYLQPAFPEITIATIGGIFGLDGARSLLLSQFLFGALVFSVMVGCFDAMTKRFWWSFVGVAIYLFAGFLFSGPWTIFQLLKPPTVGFEFLTFARPINPQISGILFYGALWGFIAWVRMKSKKGLMAAGMLTALSFYAYVYAWSLLGAFYAIVFGVYLVRRDVQRLKSLGWFAGALLIAFLPYAWNLWITARDPLYAETSMRMGMIASHHPSLGVMVVVLVVLPCLFWKRLGSAAWLVAALAVASVIALNQQVLTGRLIVSSHYHWYFIKPMAGILGMILIGSWISDRWLRSSVKKVRPGVIAVVLVIPFVICGGLFQYRSYQYALPFWRDQQASAGALTYLRTQTHAGDSVYAEGFIRDLIPVYTSTDVYWATNAYMYLSSDARARDAYFFDLWIQGVTPDEVAATFPTTRRAELSSRIHAIYYREAAGAYANMPDAEVAANVQAYGAFYQKSLASMLNAYPLTHLVVAKEDKRTEQLAAIESHSHVVYEDGAFVVRKMDK